MDNTLNGRKALVTGGAGGIGAASVRALAARGAKVVVADVDESAAAKLADEVGGSSWAVNLLDVESLQALSLDCDILVNNAGIQRISPIEEFDPADFRRIIALMLEAPFLLIRAALPHMYANNFGRIINLSSVHGLRASPFKSAYVSAKHGLEGLSKVTALEGGAHGVTSNCINPGLRPHAPGGGADRRPGQGPRHSGVRGPRQDHADRSGGQAPGGTGGSRRPWWRGWRPTTPAWSPAPATRWTAAGPRGNPLAATSCLFSASNAGARHPFPDGGPLLLSRWFYFTKSFV